MHWAELDRYLWLAWGAVTIVLLVRVFRSASIGRQAKRELYRLVDTLADWGMVVDQRGRFDHVSESVGTYLGVRPEQLLGHRWQELAFDTNRTRYQSLLDKVKPGVACSHGPERVELKLADGLSRQFDLTLHRLDIAGTSYYLCLFRDVTEHHGLQKAISRMDRLAAVAHLAGGVAHNFNNIFGGIILNAELMVGVAEAEQRQLAQRITTGAERGAELCRKLLTVARGEPPALRAIPCGPVIADLISLFETETARYGISIHSSIDGNPAVQGDPNQVRQILLNLLFNAREAIGRDGSIFVQVQPGDHAVAISVSNSGPPIPKQHLPLIFLPFFSTKTERVQGTGLGLAICQSLAAGMNGHIDVDSEPGRPTTFTLTLPSAGPGEESVA